MKSVKAFAKAVTDCRWFELGIIAIILLNATFIGMETYGSNPTIAFLLLNLVVGAVVNNYQAVMEASRAHRLANRGRSGRN